MYNMYIKDAYAHIYICLHIYCICTSCSEREANVYADVHNIYLTYTPAHTWCSTTHVNAFILSSQMHMDLCMHAYATMQQLLCHGSDCELILSLARTSCRLSFASRPPAGRRPTLSVAPLPNVVARHCSLKKSAQIHASS